MMKISIIGLDLAKQVFQVHPADAKGRCVLRKQLKRHVVLAFFAKLDLCCGDGGVRHGPLLGAGDRNARS